METQVPEKYLVQEPVKCMSRAFIDGWKTLTDFLHKTEKMNL